jgi:type I restriction enzyme, R subunit
MSNAMSESELENNCLDMLRGLGYGIVFGPDISEGVAKEREYSEVVLAGRLRDALGRINKNVPAGAIDEAVRRVIRTDSQEVTENNRAFHRLVTNGINV